MWAVEGGRVDLDGADFPVDGDRLPDVRLGGSSARVSSAPRRRRLGVLVPPGLPAGPACRRGRRGRRRAGCTLDVGSAVVTTGIHQVDNPVFDRERQPLRDRSADRAASACRCRSSASRPTACASRTSARHRERHLDGVRRPTASCSSRAASKASVYRVDADGRLRAVRDAISALRAAWRSAPTGRCTSAIAAAPSSGSAPGGATSGVCDAAGERRRVSPGDGARRVPLRHGADLAPATRCTGSTPTGRSSVVLRRASAGRRAWRSTPRGGCTWSRRWRARAASIGSDDGRRGRARAGGGRPRRRGPRSDARHGACRRTTRCIGCRYAPDAAAGEGGLCPSCSG